VSKINNRKQTSKTSQANNLGFYCAALTRASVRIFLFLRLRAQIPKLQKVVLQFDYLAFSARPS